MNKFYITDWESVWFCEYCDGRLSYYQKMYSNGRCPLCGEKGEYAGTIVDVYSKGARAYREGKWWQFWKPTKWEYKR